MHESKKSIERNTGKAVARHDWDYTQAGLPIDLPRRLVFLAVLAFSALTLIFLRLELPGA